MADELLGAAVAFLVAPEAVDHAELTSSWRIVEETGGRPCLLSIRDDTVRALRRLPAADSFEPSDGRQGATPVSFDALVLPCVLATPDSLRLQDAAVKFVREFCDTGKPVAAIDYASGVLVSADVLSGRTVTANPTLEAEILGVGGSWVDKSMFVDRSGSSVLVTGRSAGDLALFDAALVVEFSRATRQNQMGAS
ncbi:MULTISPECIES: DJ-1/PfpI family protein [Gordonia]|uniref:Peptidase C56 family protein n=1 Tax=Gordonia otitidis (strain DSM 44809 / CCUG 52243 / JCM 12355 / NBRC 100426 / IFM 10032) TaxID=1108044 RepID=H5TGI6_GORO1|nr:MULTISPECIES: DJ-1/PfpI family protein [Gordonia]MCM3896440.1 DJ-1/PfpI family protein [Gordonia sputi]GAB32594.1 peptidase C56 family protein [Gordonia otitidis NBRC 100426]